MDYREKLYNDITSYLQNMDVDEVGMLSDGIIKILSDYEVTERCTALIPVDDADEKILRRYTACIKLNGLSDKTIYQYLRACRRLREMLGKHFTEMGTYDIRYFLAMEKERGLSNVSIENTRAYISAFFQWLTDEELIPKNPVLKISTIKCKKEIRLPFSDVELDSLRSACKTKRERAIMETLLSSGVRVSELAAMKVEDINFQTLDVTVTEGKGAKERTTYITPVCAKHLQEHLKDNKKDEYLFYNKNGGRLEPGGIRYTLRELGKRAGVKNVHPHRFRRTFATNLAMRGMDIYHIKDLMGHEKIETTLMYISNDKEKVQSAYRKYAT